MSWVLSLTSWSDGLPYELGIEGDLLKKDGFLDSREMTIR